MTEDTSARAQETSTTPVPQSLRAAQPARPLTTSPWPRSSNTTCLLFEALAANNAWFRSAGAHLPPRPAPMMSGANGKSAGRSVTKSRRARGFPPSTGSTAMSPASGRPERITNCAARHAACPPRECPPMNNRAFKGTFASRYAAATRASSATEKRSSNTRGVGRYKVGTETLTPRSTRGCSRSAYAPDGTTNPGRKTKTSSDVELAVISASIPNVVAPAETAHRRR